MPKPFPLKIAIEPVVTDSFADRLERLARPLRAMEVAEVRSRFSLCDRAELLKTTLSVCPQCFEHVHAAVYSQDGRVWMAKRCERHGASTALLENDVKFYRLSNKDRWGRRYSAEDVVTVPPYRNSCCAEGETCDTTATGAWPLGFSDQRGNKSCTVLIEVTDACNLACRVCYADSKGDRLLPLEKFSAYVNELLGVKGKLDSVQLIGGEATIHPQFWELLARLHADSRIAKVYIATNGIELDKPGMPERLVPFKDKVLVLLQFDGALASTNQALRHANPERVRQRLLKKLNRLDVPMQLTMTLARGVSEREIAWVVRQGMRHRNVRLVAMLPAMFSGRYEIDHDPLDRITLSDVAKGVATGLGKRGRASDFLPIPCSHPNCGWTTLFARRFGLVANIARHVDLDAVMNDVAYQTVLDKDRVQGMIGTRRVSFFSRLLSQLGRKLVRPRDVFGIVIKPFMDRFTYDQDRVSACCHHILDTHGRLVSFCEYNTRLRAADSWQHLTKFSATQAVLS